MEPLYLLFYAALLCIAGFLFLRLIQHLSHVLDGHHLALERSPKNPILGPNRHNQWESEAVFNPAAVYLGGRVHLLYRALGPEGLSRIGYASSKDGIHFDERLSYPVYEPRERFESGTGPTPPNPCYDPSMYVSGGGWGGCEDPKLTALEGRVYMTYVACNGWDSIRIALTSITENDFLKKNWNKWARPRLISKPGQINKSAILMNEKINGKYVMFHRVFPDVLIDHLDSLHFPDGQYLETKGKIPKRDSHWDSRKLSIAAAPIKIPEGWLAVYHAVDDRDDSKYKIGVMILDRDDPSKVLYRSSYPILTPQAWYENAGKPGVAYPSGVVNIGDTLFVYYGGGDTLVCVATASIKKIRRSLVRHEHAVFKSEPVAFRKQ